MVHSGDMLTFFDELRAARVSSFSAPPQIFNLLYASYKSAVEIGVRQRGEEHRAAIEKAAKLDVLGIFPRARLISTGGATSAQYVLDWMREVVQLGTCTFQEGYGISEVGNVASNGIRAWECKVHIEPVPELGYSFAPDDNPVRGLLWAHSKDLTLGYFGDTEKTNSVFKDIFGDGRRWFNTGDIVYGVPKSTTIWSFFFDFLPSAASTTSAPRSCIQSTGPPILSNCPTAFLW